MQSLSGRSFLGAASCGLLLLAGCAGGTSSWSSGTSNPAPKPPVANAGGPYSGTVASQVSFNGGASTDPQSESLTYAWSFGDNTTGTSINPTHTYATPGTYTVSLTVTDTSNLSNTSTAKAMIAAAPPVGNAGGPYAGTSGTAVSFSGSASTDPQGEALTYAWNFGDSTTGTGAAPTHTYAAPGTYTVSLMVTNTSGLSNTATSNATVANAPLSDVSLTGVVYDGQQPIVGAHVYLFAANTTGYGGAGIAASSSNASVSLISGAETGTSDSVGAYVATGSNGGFSLTGDYSCTSGQQLYLYVLGGNSGAGTNAAAGLMAALGSCLASGNPGHYLPVTVNEVTTIAAAYALAGFATDATHVSSSGTALAQVGIANAFANSGNLASVSTGAALATTPAGNGIVPQAEINMLANILAACVNSIGASSASCSALFTNAESSGSTGGAPSDTATAAINLAHNPGSNIAALYAIPTGSQPFSPSLMARPNDFTIALNFTGGGLDFPYGIAIDAVGNVWAANQNNGCITELAPSGLPISPSTGYRGGGLDVPLQIAIDLSGNAWTANALGNGVSEFSSVGAALSPATGFIGGGLHAPDGIAIDGIGDVWVTSNNYRIVEFSSAGNVVSGLAGYTASGGIALNSLAIDASGHVWGAGETNASLVELSPLGAALSPPSGYTGGGVGAVSIAVDGSANIWTANFSTLTFPPTSSLSKFSNSGIALSPFVGFTGGGLNNPAGIAVDGSGDTWVSNIGNSSLSEFSNAGVAVSPATGFTGGGLSTPGILAVDGSGDIWVTSQGSSSTSVAEFVGAGTPVVTPLAVGVKNNMLGTRP